MKKVFSVVLITLFTLTGFTQDLSYYLPDSVTYDAAVPKPSSVIHHEVGEWHVTHDRLVNYMRAIATAVPGRVKLETMGLTYENRPQVLLVITSPKNHQNLEAIRQQHISLTDAGKSATADIASMPVVVWMGHSIHGNEASGSNASLLSAYYLAAAQGKQIDELLQNVVILFDPSFNPDGLQRFSTWVNQHKSKNLVTDPNSREFNEVWPGGRFNHYWFDLNRDWLPAVHVESQNRLAWFHKWKPNILTDHHEQGSNATFFFQPGVPSRVNPLTPAKNMELTEKMGKFHAAFLDRIGSLYFTRENYDDFYYGKGSTYPDVNGAIGILFEQASSRGHAQQTANGILRFPFAVKNQFITALSTLEAAKAMRTEFLAFQRDFYKGIQAEGAASSVKGYVFGSANNRGAVKEFLTMLKRHQINIFHLGNNIKADGIDFTTGGAYVVPSAQPQHRLIKAIFEKTLTYKDSLFYDITAWTMPLAYGLPSAELGAGAYNPGLLGTAYTESEKPVNALARSEYAYLLPWTELFAPAALYELQGAGIIPKIATAPFELTVAGSRKKFDHGTVMISVQGQPLASDKLFALVKQITDKYSLPVYSITSGSSLSGSDLGSSKFVAVTKPSVAMLTGAGVSPLDAGEFWHLMDQRMNMPLSHLDISTFNRADLSKYTTIVLVSGIYNELNREKLRQWVQAGGVLIAMEDAVTWAATAGISNVTFKKVKGGADSTQTLRYSDKDQIEGAQAMRGAIFRAEADLTHPLAYGYEVPYVSMFKGNKVYMERSKNPFATPFIYKDAPLQSGWLSRQNKDAVKNSAAVVVSGLGSGKVISIADNPNFRAFWLGGAKLMMNAIFFGKMIDTGFTAE